MEAAVSPSLLKRLLKDFKFDPEVAKDLKFDDFVEQVSLSPPADICVSYNQDEEATEQLLLAASQVYEEKVPVCAVSYNQDEEVTDQLLLAASQVYEEKVASELPLTVSQSSQQGNLVNQAIIPEEKQSFPVLLPFAQTSALTKPTL